MGVLVLDSKVLFPAEDVSLVIGILKTAAGDSLGLAVAPWNLSFGEKGCDLGATRHYCVHFPITCMVF
jgi:hypothetical protein